MPSRAATSSGPIRRSVWMMAAIVVVGLALLTIPSRTLKIATGKPAHDVQPTSHQSAEHESASVPVARAISSNSVIPSSAESFERTRQLVKFLSDVQPGELTPQKADRWKHHLEEVIEEGRAAVPVLEEYLDSNANVRFDTASGSSLLGEPTLRIALLKVLFDIPTPDNVNIQEKVLQSTTDPEEIALLAQQLEQQEPGEHYRSIIQAARRGLQAAGSGQLSDRDTSSLVKILEGYGIPVK